MTEGSTDGTVSWRELLAETTRRLLDTGIEQASGEARWIVQTASGLEGAEMLLGLDDPATQRGVAHLDSMVERRSGGEPLQYVLGSWGFRTLDLLCDPRALIPRPETEQVVEVALTELDRLPPIVEPFDSADDPPPIVEPFGSAGAPLKMNSVERSDRSRSVGGPGNATVVDLGTGTGAIALSIAVERPGIEVWGVDSSADALAVARANLAGLGMAGGRVRLAEGDWFAALPDELRGAIHLVVTNPPYVAADEDLPRSVADWEPADALVAGPSGLECYERIFADAPGWLAPGGAVVAEIGATQGEALCDLAHRAGFVDCRVEQDHAGLDRVVVAISPTGP